MIHYRDEFESTEQIIDINFAMLYVMLHQEALLKAIDLLSSISSSLEWVRVPWHTSHFTHLIIQFSQLLQSNHLNNAVYLVIFLLKQNM